ncbi:PEP-CTERM sorting domain-containing protein [Floridanema evergladense]|uniref:PEP-CTERM sorting domain-containing protein n=1 Tax=Floridaenema evergladense BLCC-F167 TaxID=3153639 RepID=A0ABV4WXE1_9CYAN
MTALKHLSIIIVGTAVVFGSSNIAEAASFYVSTSAGQLGTVDQSTGVFTQIGSGTSPAFTDIALSNEENLFGVTDTNLYSINKNSGVSSNIGSLGFFMNGLGFNTSNELYGTGDSGFYKINLATGAASLVANIAGFNSSGDLVYDRQANRFLATSSEQGSDSLWSIDLNGTATKIGNIGFLEVYGLAFDDEGSLFGYTSDRQQIAIDLTTGTGTLKQNVTGLNSLIWGAASLPSSSPRTSVPEPTSLVSLLGIAGLVAASLKQRQKAKLG